MLELFTTHLLAIISIGPNTIIMLNASTSTTRTVVMTALGITVAQFAHISYSLAIGQVLTPNVTNVLVYMGSAYLVYMGVMTIRYAKSKNRTREVGFRDGVVVNLLNGKVIAYFLAIFPPLTAKFSWLEVSVVILVLTCMVFLWFTFVGLIGGTIKNWLNRHSTPLNYLFGMCFIGLGLLIAY